MKMLPTTGRQSKLKGKVSTYQHYSKKRKKKEKEKEHNKKLGSPAWATIGGRLDFSPESSPRKTKTLLEIYQTCNLKIVEPDSYEVASEQ